VAEQVRAFAKKRTGYEDIRAAFLAPAFDNPAVGSRFAPELNAFQN
jgi:hypothetical protein